MTTLHNRLTLMRTFLAIALLPLLLFSCKKNILKGNTTAEVYLREKGTNDPINGGQVYLYGAYVTGGGLSGGTSLSLIETYTTNADGYTYIDFKQKDYKEEDFDYFTLRAHAAQYYEEATEYDLNTKEDNEVTIMLDAEAYLNVTITKTGACNGERVYLGSFGNSPSGGGETYYCQTQNKYTTFGAFPAFTDAHLRYEVIVDVNNQMVFYDTIKNLQPHQTIEYPIEY